ncbi:hypothetical protein [Paenibacillus mendelii]|uniref:DUF4830 domain-containing protein n=1 Tax=Paenibacillus mendelii TaxID=206163 RepID=A0ABV6JHM2_9BACL|nr:hypothetical protein [Paenibacillus mendelii]MCQ6563847.1 hypothetical protein [Paenibacillus mendelii]
MKIWISLLLLIFSLGCNERNEIPKEQSVLQSYLESKGYQVISYEGRGYRYELTKQKIIELPYMMYWGLQSVDPSDYFGKTINIEQFIVTNHPLSEGEVDVAVFEVEGQPIGGTSQPHGDPSYGGYWSLDGHTLEELQPKSFQEWRKEWVVKYTE